MLNSPRLVVSHSSPVNGVAASSVAAVSPKSFVTTSRSSPPTADDEHDEELDRLLIEQQLPCIPFDLGNPSVEVIEGRLFLSHVPPLCSGAEDAESDDFDDDEEDEETKPKNIPENIHVSRVFELEHTTCSLSSNIKCVREWDSNFFFFFLLFFGVFSLYDFFLSLLLSEYEHRRAV